MKIITSSAARKSAILLGLLFLIQFHANAQGCNCPPIASCTPCQGGLTSLTLRYDGPLAVSITVSDGSALLYTGVLVPTGTIITVTGSLANDLFSGSQLSAVVTLILNFNTNTNCLAGISVGQTLGSFTVLAAESLVGGPLCCDAGDLETVDPVISGCPGDIVVPSNALGCSADVSWVPPTAADNCGGVTLTSTYNPGATFSVGTTTVTYTATDDYGNTSLCLFDVTVNDETDPVIAGCPGDITVSADALCETNVSWIEPTATDNCGAVTFISSHLPGTTFPLGTTPILYTATDTEGNISTCTFDVIVNDDADPIITGCPSTDIIAVANASCQAVVSWTAPVASDNCGVTSWISSHDPGDTFDSGTTVVTYTAADAAGNLSTCTFNVIVNDETDPVFTGCLADIIVTANAMCQATVGWIAPSRTDNCGSAGLTSNYSPGSIFSLGTTKVIYTATDGSGNTSTCEFNVIVQDDTDPVIAGCPPTDIIVSAGPSCQANVSWPLPTATDNCSMASFTGSYDPGDVFPLGTTVVLYTAIDGVGNVSTCSFNVVVNDDSDPIISGCIVSDIVVAANGSCQGTATWTAPTVTDNCGPVTMISTKMPGSTFSLGTTPVSYTATDGFGNVSVCTFNVIVEDQTPPVFSGCISSDVLVTPNASCQAIASWLAPTATDNCGATLTSSSHDPGDTFPLGTTVVTYTAEDAAGNMATCSFNVIVEDQTDPVFAGCIASDIVVFADASCQATATWAVPVASDNCGVPIVTNNHFPGSIFPFGTTQVTYTATDGSGNIATCSFNVIVQDNIDPIIAGCISSDIIGTANGSCEATATWTPPTATDNCGAVTLTSSHDPGETFSLGTTTVTYTATDGSGNVSICSFDVIINDVSDPIFAGCNATDIVVTANSSCEAVASWTPPTATDNCGIPLLVSTHPPGSTFPLGTTLVTYTATDGSGNIGECSFNVIVEDKTPPSIKNCVSDIVVNADAACSVIVQWAPPEAEDNCDTVALTTTNAPGSTFPVGTTIVKYTATDGAGNTTVCQFNVVVRGETPPQFIYCPEDISVYSNEFGEAVVEWTSPSATADCGGAVTLSSSYNSGDIFGIGVTEVEYKAEDNAGNISYCRFNVEVIKQEIEIDISKVVTPDGNGVNDEWVVTNIEKFSNNKVVIVDRWGSVIYTASGYNNGNVVWSGASRDGATVPTGTYFYTIFVRFGEDSFEKTGFIELIR